MDPTDDRRSPAIDNLRMTLLMAAIALAAAAFSEVVPRHGGLGWDGNGYGKLAKDFLEQLRDRSINVFRFSRGLPSLLVHLGLLIGGIQRTTPAVVAGFRILNAAAIAGAAACWGPAADALGLGRRAKWIGFAGLFLNFGVLKGAFYCPVMTDTLAFGLAAAALLAWATRHRVLLWLVLLATAFTWPAFWPGATLLLLFPRGPVAAAPTRDPRRRLAWMLAVLMGLATLVAVGVIAWRYVRGQDAIQFGEYPPLVAAFPLSCPIAALYVGLGAAPLLLGCELLEFATWRRAVAIGRVIAIVALGAVPFFLARSLSNGSTGLPIGPGAAARMVLLLTISHPAGFLVGFVMYFGPIVLAAAFLWRRVAAEVVRAGPAMTGCMLLLFVNSINPMARAQLWLVWFAMPWIARAVAERLTAVSTLVVLVGGQLLFSQFWLPFNPSLPADESAREAMPLWDAYPLLEANMGAWVTDGWYLVHLVAVVAMGGVLAWCLWRERRRAGTRTCA